MTPDKPTPKGPQRHDANGHRRVIERLAVHWVPTYTEKKVEVSGGALRAWESAGTAYAVGREKAIVMKETQATAMNAIGLERKEEGSASARTRQTGWRYRPGETTKMEWSSNKSFVLDQKKEDWNAVTQVQSNGRYGSSRGERDRTTEGRDCENEA